MPFSNKSVVTYEVFRVEIHDEDFDDIETFPIGHISARTDRKGKKGYSVSNAAVLDALIEGRFLKPNARVEIEGNDDGVMSVIDSRDEPVLQLEYEKHHNEPEPGIFGEAGASRGPRANPTGLSTGATVALVGLGVVVVGGLGYYLYSKSQAAQQAAAQPGLLPASNTMTPTPGVLDQNSDAVPPFVPGT